MAEKKEKDNDTADRELVITRLLNAPKELVWEVFTTPGHIKNWWGPNGFTNTIDKMDVKPGGIWEFVMHGPDGTNYKNKSIYKEIVKHERIVFEHVTGPKFTTTITFTPEGKKTMLKWHMLFESKEEFIQVVKTFKADEGLKQNIEKLEKYLINNQTNNMENNAFEITRVFNASPELIFKAFSQAEHLAQWWGPKGFKMVVTKLDFKPGGIFHYSMQSPDGQIMWGKFVYREIEVPGRVVFISSFSDEAGNVTRAPFSANWPLEVLNNMTLTGHEGKTTLTLRGGPINATAEEIKMFVDRVKKGMQL